MKVPPFDNLIRQIQPSDYRLDEFYLTAALTLEHLGVQPPPLDGWQVDEFANEMFDEMCESVGEEYVIVQADDYWAVYHAE